MKSQHHLTTVSVFILALFCGAQVYAAETLTWQASVQEARKNHPDLVSASEKINQFKTDKSIAASAFFPQVSADAGIGTSKSGSSKRTDSFSYGVSARQLVFDGFKTAADVEQAAKNVDASRYNYEVTSSNVRLRLRQAFVDLLRAQEFLTLAQNISVRRKQSRDLIELRYNGGRENRGALLTSEANLAQAEFDIRQAQRDIDLSQRRLSKELGRTQLTPLTAQGDFTPSETNPEKPDFENLSIATPLMQGLVVQKEAARWGIKSANASFLPQVYADASLGRSASQWPPRENEWSAGASFNVPLFEGGNLAARAARARAVFGQAQADEKSGRDGVIFTLEDTWTQFQDARERVDVEQKFLNATQERSRIAEAQYSAGLITFNDWIIIEDNLVSVQKAFLNAQADALLTEAEWLQARGETLDGD